MLPLPSNLRTESCCALLFPYSELSLCGTYPSQTAVLARGLSQAVHALDVLSTVAQSALKDN